MLQYLVFSLQIDGYLQRHGERPDVEWFFIDDIYTKEHQYSAGAASDVTEALAKAARVIPARFIWQLLLTDSQLPSGSREISCMTIGSSGAVCRVTCQLGASG